jgi:hypothetical protein
VGARVGRSITLSSSQTESHSITRSSLNQGRGDVELGGKEAAPPNRNNRLLVSGFRAEVTGRRYASVIQRHATTGRFGLLTQKMAENN